MNNDIVKKIKNTEELVFDMTGKPLQEALVLDTQIAKMINEELIYTGQEEVNEMPGIVQPPMEPTEAIQVEEGPQLNDLGNNVIPQAPVQDLNEIPLEEKIETEVEAVELKTPTPLESEPENKPSINKVSGDEMSLKSPTFERPEQQVKEAISMETIIDELKRYDQANKEKIMDLNDEIMELEESKKLAESSKEKLKEGIAIAAAEMQIPEVPKSPIVEESQITDLPTDNINTMDKPKILQKTDDMAHTPGFIEPIDDAFKDIQPIGEASVEEMPEIQVPVEDSFGNEFGKVA